MLKTSHPWISWSRDALAASQTNLALNLGDTNVGTAGSGIVMLDAGSVRGITVHSNTVTAGSATFTVFLNGVATTLTVVLDTTDTQTNYKLGTSGEVVFARGDFLDVRVTTTAAWAAGNADVNATLVLNVEYL